MGIGLVLIFWGVVGLVGATLASFVLPIVVSQFSRGTGNELRRLVFALCVFPFACVFWAGAAFVFYGTVNMLAFHRDPGIGDGLGTPLPNGVLLESIDVFDRCSLHKNDPAAEDAYMGEPLVSDVRALQLAGQYILGRVQRGTAPEGAPDSVEFYFVLDTKTSDQAKYQTLIDLRSAADKLHVQLALEPFYDVYTRYTRYRFTWFDGLGAILIFGVPLAGACLLFRRAVRIR